MPGILDRLEAKGLGDPGKMADDSLAQALKLYGEAKWEEARSALDIYLQQHPDEPIAQLYMGLTLLQLSDYTKASRFLMPLADDTDFQYQNMAKWYLALCYTYFNTAESVANACKLLKDLTANPESGYYIEALGHHRFMCE
ncbi:MAG: hypothetical protein IPM82_20695 [Saprospiraceae bacterium]|nr:hypothetical protein [Saprospiraceae bacterium]